MTREEWLNGFINTVRDLFADKGYTVPENVRITCGFPSKSATSRKNRRIGECWDSSVSTGKVFEIFISPVLDDALTVAATAAHELAHATVGIEAGHRAPFVRCVRAIGLEGKATATVAGPAFADWFVGQSNVLGAYPHQALNATSAAKKQTTRMLKVECPHCRDEGDRYIVRMSASAYERGAPICPIHGEEMLLA